jgi:hypothetical protein
MDTASTRMDREATPTRPSAHEVNHGGRATAAAKAADLLSSLGAMVLGAGLVLVLPTWLRSHAVPLLVAGAVVHGLGMSLRYRMDQRAGKATWWERLLFWLCWACLAALGAWMAMNTSGSA